MKILIVNAVNDILSTGRFCSELKDYLIQNGHSCFVAYSTGRQTENSFQISSTIECKIHALMSRLTGMQGYFSLFSTRKLINYIKEYEPDIVQLNNLHANYIHLSKLLDYLAKKNIATVVTLHDCWFYTGKCTHYTSIQCMKWKTGCFDCPKLKDDHNSWFFDRTPVLWSEKKEKFSSISQLAVIGVSDWITNEAKQSFLSGAKIIKRIYNGIDLAKFKPNENSQIKKKLGIMTCKIILGVASEWNNKKGLDKFINLSPELKEDERIVLVGKYKNNIKLPDNIISIPQTNNVEELVAFYSAADVFLQLSEEETFGKVVTESLACGTPVITNNKTANPELVNSTCGIVLENLDEKTIRIALDEVFTRGKEYYSDNCVAHVVQCYDIDKCMQEYLQTYMELDNRKKILK